MRIFLSGVFLFLMSLSTWADEAEKRKICLPWDKETFILVKDIQTCRDFVDNAKLSQREKAQVLLQLGIAVQFSGAKSVALIEEKSLETIALYKKAVAVDPTYDEPYLILATALKFKEQNEEALQVLDQGIAVLPNAPRLLADKSEILAKSPGASGIKLLCDTATASPQADQTVYEACARSLLAAGYLDGAEAVFKKATQQTDFSTRKRYGIWQSNHIRTDYANFLDQQGRTKEAADFLEAYLSKMPVDYVDSFDRQLLADLFERSDNPAKASEQFELAANLAASGLWKESAFKLRLQALVNRVKSGDMAGGRKLSQFMFEGASKNHILQLQVRLKNGTQRQLKITGIYDTATVEALDTCLNDKECFSESASPRL